MTPSNFATRSLVAVIGGAALIGCIWHSDQSTFALFGIIFLFAFVESLRLVKLASFSRAAPFALTIFFAPSAYFDLFPWIASILTILILAGLKYPKLLLALYPAQIFAGFASAALMRVDHGRAILLMALVATWSADTGAYLVGMKYGRVKLAPEISPKKTREGAIGGLVFSILACIAAGTITGELRMGIIFGCIAGIAGQIGDLAESKLKRLANRKDSGSILPGHGGALDRFDAFLVNAPLCYAAAVMLS